MSIITLLEFLQFTGTFSAASPIGVHEDILWGCSANTVPSTLLTARMSLPLAENMRCRFCDRALIPLLVAL